MGYSLEVDMVREAKKLGLLTTPYAFNIEEAKAMAEAGADVVVGALIADFMDAVVTGPFYSTYGIDHQRL